MNTRALKRRLDKLRERLADRRRDVERLELQCEELRPRIHDLSNRVRHLQVHAMRLSRVRVQIEGRDDDEA